MNDFERKLSQQPFRTPPADWRAAIFGAAEEEVIQRATWTWRDWLWPSPQAWAALAAVWLIFAAFSFGFGGSAAPKSPVMQQPAASVTLLTFHQHRALDHVLELPN